MFKKKGIRIKTGQVWSIGKGTQKLVRESNGLGFDIGDSVRINDTFVGDSLINVVDVKTGVKFDVRTINLGVLLSN